MVISKFDQMLFEFVCQCGEVTEEMLSNLDGKDVFACPACDFVADLKSDPWRAYLMSLRDTASEIDKQAMQRGEVIERIK